jgi:hypothetical protein
MSAFGEPLIPLVGYVLGGSPLMLARPQTAIATDKPTTLSTKGSKLIFWEECGADKIAALKRPIETPGRISSKILLIVQLPFCFLKIMTKHELI